MWPVPGVNVVYGKENGMKFLICIFLLGMFTMVGAEQEQYPTLELANDELRVVLYLPDAKQGFYRGTRFDW